MTTPTEAAWQSLHSDASAIVHALSGRSLITVTGKDRASWLNGVITQDVRALTPGRGVYATSVAVKGKLLADLWVHPTADALVLVVPTGQREALLAHFDRYVVMEDVTLADDARRVVTVQGPGASALTEGFDAVFQADRLGAGGVDVLVAPEAVGEVLATLSARGATVVDEPAWEAVRVRAGVPQWGVDFGTDHFVQEAAVTPRAVSFHKGCYLGQEVVCRLEMRGHVQKHLVTLAVEGAAPPVGAPIVQGEATVGAVTSATAAGDQGIAIGMLKYSVVEKGLPVTVEGRAAKVGAIGKALV